MRWHTRHIKHLPPRRRAVSFSPTQKTPSCTMAMKRKTSRPNSGLASGPPRQKTRYSNGTYTKALRARRQKKPLILGGDLFTMFIWIIFIRSFVFCLRNGWRCVWLILRRVQKCFPNGALRKFPCERFINLRLSVFLTFNLTCSSCAWGCRFDRIILYWKIYAFIMVISWFSMKSKYI